MCKLDETKLEELCVLNELENSILSQGKIELAENGFDPAEKDKPRLEEFFKLQDKYAYGWLIAQQAQWEQIRSINRFKEFIINGEIKFDSVKITIKNDRDQVIASFVINDDMLNIPEGEYEGCYIHHVVENGKLGYVVQLLKDVESLDNVSTELLLNELASRIGE